MSCDGDYYHTHPMAETAHNTLPSGVLIAENVLQRPMIFAQGLVSNGGG